MQLSSVTTAARQERGVLPQPPKIRGVCRSGRNPHRLRPNLELSSQPLTRSGDRLSRSAGGGARLPTTGALRAALSQPGSGTFSTPCLCGVIKHRAYFHLQQGLQHCCAQICVLLWRKGRMAILSCFCKALGAYSVQALRAAIYHSAADPGCGRARRAFWAVP